MSRPVEFTEKDVMAAKEIIEQAKGNNQLMEALAIQITAVTQAPIEQVAEILGKSKATISRMRKRFQQFETAPKKEKQRPKKGGRRNELLSFEEEKEFLNSFAEKARKGRIIVVPPMRLALEERVGKKVAKSTVYAMLARHGWRKVKPDTKHPKADPGAQKTFKKNSQKLSGTHGVWLPPKKKN